MALLKPIKLGRPCCESLFEINPSGIVRSPNRISDNGRGLDGSMIDVTMSRYRPTVTIKGNYITPVQAQQFASLTMIDDTPLILELYDFVGDHLWESWTERVIPDTLTSIPIPANSWTRAADIKDLCGGQEVIRLVGLWDDCAPAGGREGAGPNLLVLDPTATRVRENFNNRNLGPIHAQGGWLNVGADTTKVVVVDECVGATVLEGPRGIDFLDTGLGTGTGSRIEHAIGPFPPTGTLDNSIITWEMQLVNNSLNSLAECFVFGTFLTIPGSPFTTLIKATSTTSANMIFTPGSAPSAVTIPLTNPFGPHKFKLVLSATGHRFFLDGVLVSSGTETMTDLEQFVFQNGAFDPQTPIAMRADNVSVSTGDHYDPQTGKVELINPLPNLCPRFLTYQAVAIACKFNSFPLQQDAGWVKHYKYNFVLEGS